MAVPVEVLPSIASVVVAFADCVRFREVELERDEVGLERGEVELEKDKAVEE